MINPDLITGRLGNRMFQFAYVYSQFKDGLIPDVYLQSEKFFKNHAQEIKMLFGAGIGQVKYVGIHVRRGDYVGNSFYTDLFKDAYYERAMEQFDGREFLVVSDDIAWCKKQQLFKRCTFAEGKNEIEDFNLLASCTGHIMANSSFSWWAAYLSPHGGKVVAPEKWFTDNVKRVDLLDSWITV